VPSSVRRGRAVGGMRHRERGETLIEFAFASVIFFMMIFGTIEFGLAVWQYNLVSDLAMEGARFAAVHGQNSGDPKTEADVEDFLEGRASGLDLDVTTPDGSPDALVAGELVSVRVSHTLNWGGGLLPAWTFPVAARAQMPVTR